MLLRLHVDVATIILDYLATQVEPYARGLTCSLGGEEWVENLVKDGMLNTDTVVVEFELHLLVLDDGSKPDFGLVLVYLVALRLLDDGIDGVAQHTHERLTQLLGIAINEDIVGRNFENGIDVVFGNLLIVVFLDHLFVLME